MEIVSSVTSKSSYQPTTRTLYDVTGIKFCFGTEFNEEHIIDDDLVYWDNVVCCYCSIAARCIEWLQGHIKDSNLKAFYYNGQYYTGAFMFEETYSSQVALDSIGSLEDFKVWWTKNVEEVTTKQLLTEDDIYSIARPILPDTAEVDYYSYNYGEDSYMGIKIYSTEQYPGVEDQHLQLGIRCDGVKKYSKESLKRVLTMYFQHQLKPSTALPNFNGRLVASCVPVLLQNSCEDDYEEVEQE